MQTETTEKEVNVEPLEKFQRKMGGTCLNTMHDDLHSRNDASPKMRDTEMQNNSLTKQKQV